MCDESQIQPDVRENVMYSLFQQQIRGYPSRLLQFFNAFFLEATL